jgi:ABC-type antimicrobial peptide transport system permease subunit
VFVSASLGVGTGVAAGTILSLAFGKVLSSWVEIDSRDPVALASSAAVLLVMAALACLVPARRASEVDPMDALRCERRSSSGSCGCEAIAGLWGWGRDHYEDE